MKNMKTENLKKRVLVLGLGALIASSSTAFANSEYIEDQFSGEIPIDIDGSFSRPTASSKLEQTRKKLEKQNEEMVQKKIEDIRVDNEMKLTEQLQGALGGEMPFPTADNSSRSKIEKKTKGGNDLVDMTLNLGVSNVSSDALDLETSITGKLSIDAKIKDQFLVGLGIGYSNISMTPLSDIVGSSYFSPYYGNGFYNVNGILGRPVDYDQLDISANAKFLFVRSSKLTPYIGVGVVYSRFNMNFEGSNMSFNMPQPINGDQGRNGSFMSLNANLGTRLMFSEMLGVNLEIGYTRGVGGVLGGVSNYSLVNPDQEVLNRIANEISESNVFGIQGGLLLSF